MAPDLDLDLDFKPDPDPIRVPKLFSPLAFLFLVERFYAGLIHNASSAEAGLGGRLLYVGDLGSGHDPKPNQDGRVLMVAANIAGAASLVATADPVTQKQFIHEGVADFLVTSLDEALRILKNEIRRAEPVAVCIAAAHASIEQEMVERGVLPDLVRDLDLAGTADRVVPFGGSPVLVAPLDPAEHESIISWGVDEAPAQWLPRLDAIAMDCLAADESLSAQIARRWLHLAPRYLGRLAGNVRVLRCSAPAANGIVERMRAAIQSGKISVPVRIDSV